MTIDERLKALAQTVERLVHDHEALTRDVKAMQSALRDTGNHVNEIAQATARLLHIAQIHEHRLEKLEGSA